MGQTRAGPYPKDISQCRGCGDDIVWVKTKRGKRMPVNVVPSKPDFRGPNAGELKYTHGEHEPHWSTCSNSDDFRVVPTEY